MSQRRGRGHTPLNHTYLLPRPQSLAQRSPSPWQHSTLTPVTLLNIHNIMSIETPPSSPKLNQPNQLYRDDLLDQSDVSRTKTSEWLKQVSIDANQSDQLSLSVGQRSTKKSRQKKFVSGGLVEQLHRLWDNILGALLSESTAREPKGAYVYMYMYMYIIPTCMHAHIHTHKK